MVINKTCRQRYDEQLGMRVSKASRLLKLQVTLSLLQKLNLDECERCKTKITDPYDLSLDHILPWRNNDSSLFWDISNVRYVHKKCNKTDRPAGRQCPEGTSWCAKHKEFLPIETFGKSKSSKNGLNIYCLQCDRERMSRYEKTNPRQKCSQCNENGVRKVCRFCGFELPMKDYMRMRRNEGVKY